MKKDIFVYRYEQSDMRKNYNRFLNKMEELKLYLVEFDKNDKIKDKTYPSNCAVDSKDR